MEREKNSASQMNAKQRKFDQMLADEKATCQALVLERDSFEKLARQNETKALSLQNANEELEDRLVEVNKQHKYFTTLNCN